MRIVVLGAGGFIGGWICEELAVRGDVEVLACIRRWPSAVRLARRGIPLAKIDIVNAQDLHAVVAGADVVVNAAMPPPQEEPEAASRLFASCREAGVARFVQLSSIAVYGDRTGHVSEEQGLAPTDDYGNSKATMEDRLLRAAAHGGPQLFILRAPIVYGPFSEPWTVRYARRIATFRWRTLGRAGGGICNVVHAEDVAAAVLLAATKAVPGGSHVLNLNGPELVSWNEYIERFGDALNIADRSTPHLGVFTASAVTLQAMRGVVRWLKARGMRRSEGVRATVIERAQSVVKLYPNQGELRLLRREVRYSAERVASVLGFHASTPLGRGLQQSADWCRIHGVI